MAKIPAPIHSEPAKTVKCVADLINNYVWDNESIGLSFGKELATRSGSILIAIMNQCD